MEQATLSTVVLRSAPQKRITKQELHILDFIHRFRHVTAHHVQIYLRHAHISTTTKLLASLRKKGYVSRRPKIGGQGSDRSASHFLTVAGLDILKAQHQDRKYRQVRSVRADATVSLRAQERCHVLADAYTYFKRHHDGAFKFSTSFDIAGLACMPDELPDGFVSIDLPDIGRCYYFVELYGWNRSSEVQRRRLYGYLQFMESEQWGQSTEESEPALFIVTSSKAARARLHAQFSKAIAHSLTNNLQVYTTVADMLGGEDSKIWREMVTGG